MARRPTGKQQRDEAGRLVTVAGRAGNGSGSVYFDKGKGRWRATYLDPRTGKQRTVMAATRAEVEARRDTKLAELAEAPDAVEVGPLGAEPTIADLCSWWLTYTASAAVRPTTLSSYARQVELITDRVGALPVERLDVATVRVLIAELGAELAPHTVRNVRARLRQIAEEGVTLGYLPTNPVPLVKAPRVDPSKGRGPKRVLSAEETRRLVAACDGHRLGAAVALLFLLGNRSSEVLGLAWGDVSLDAGTATIRRGSTYLRGVGQVLDDPKTTSTAGTHHLPPTVVRLLRQRRQVQLVERLEAGPLWERTEYRGELIEPVFTTATGSLVLSQILYKAVRSVAEAAGVDTASLGTHTGRRTVVTALYGSGLDLDDVARHVGHGSTATTAGYVQSLGTRPERTARIAAELLDPEAGAHHGS